MTVHDLPNDHAYATAIVFDGDLDREEKLAVAAEKLKGFIVNAGYESDDFEFHVLRLDAEPHTEKSFLRDERGVKRRATIWVIVASKKGVRPPTLLR